MTTRQTTNSSGDDTPALDTLDGIPGIGPARRASLAATGITTRAGLCALGAAELARITRMPGAQAEQVILLLTSSKAGAAESPNVVASDAPTPTEPLTESAVSPQPVPPSEGEMQEAVSRVRAAVTRLAQHEEATRLVKPLARLQRMLDELPMKASTISPKRQKRLVERLDALVARMEKATEKDDELAVKQAKRLRERLREERRTISEMMARRPRRMPNSRKLPTEKKPRDGEKP